MNSLDIDKLIERSQIGIQTIAVVLLGWLATSINSLDTEIKFLNAKMIAIVEITKYHENRIARIEDEAKDGQIMLQRLQLEFRDKIEKLRDNRSGSK